MAIREAVPFILVKHGRSGLKDTLNGHEWKTIETFLDHEDSDLVICFTDVKDFFDQFKILGYETYSTSKFEDVCPYDPLDWATRDYYNKKYPLKKKRTSKAGSSQDVVSFV